MLYPIAGAYPQPTSDPVICRYANSLGGSVMYFPDLSPYPYGKQPSKLSIGWLDDRHEYAQGEVPNAVVEKLLSFCRSPVLRTLGGHECEFCQSASGSGEIWVFS